MSLTRARSAVSVVNIPRRTSTMTVAPRHAETSAAAHNASFAIAGTEKMNAVATVPTAITPSEMVTAASTTYSTAAVTRAVEQLRASRLTLSASPRFDAGVTELTARPA